jgi:hypothetical protein
MASTEFSKILGDLLPDRLVAERYKVTLRTIFRWDRRPDLRFPPAIRINNRNYRFLDQLEAWEQQRLAESIGRPQKTVRTRIEPQQEGVA